MSSVSDKFELTGHAKSSNSKMCAFLQNSGIKEMFAGSHKTTQIGMDQSQECCYFNRGQ